MGLDFLDIRTDEALLQQLQLAGTIKMTASEMFEQKVSFAYSSLSQSNTLTKDEVRRIIGEREGRDTEIAKHDSVRAD